MAFPILYKALVEWINTHGGNMAVVRGKPSSRVLAEGLYEGAEDTAAAQQLINETDEADARIARYGVNAEDTERRPHEGGQIPSTGARAAHQIGMRFKHPADKFSGEDDEFWEEFVEEYDLVCENYGLDETQKLMYLHNLVRGNAKRFYLTSYIQTCRTYIQAVGRIAAEYNSPVKQNQIHNKLSDLRMRSFVVKGMKLGDALTETYRVILKLSTMTPPAFVGESYRVSYLRGAVIGYPWATGPLSRISTHNLSFLMLFNELQSSLHLHEEAQRAVLRDNAALGMCIDAKEPRVMYQGQARYRRQPCPPASGCHFLYLTVSRALFTTSGQLSTCSKNICLHLIVIF